MILGFISLRQFLLALKSFVISFAFLCFLLKSHSNPIKFSWSHKLRIFIFQSRAMVGGQETMRGESLTFPRSSRHHAGIYTCAADNGWGTPATASIHLNVLHAPEIEQEETFIHSRDGDEVEVVCIVHSSPRSEVEWYRNGQLLDPSRSIITTRGNRHSLLIQKIGEFLYFLETSSFILLLYHLSLPELEQ